MRYWEDLAVGDNERYGRHELTHAEIADFTARFAPPAVDAPDTDAAPGYMLCCVAMRLLVDHALSDMASLGSPGVDRIEWPMPAHAGDVLTLTTETLSSRALESRPEMGLIKQQTRLENQHGQIVARMQTNALIARRGSAS